MADWFKKLTGGLSKTRNSFSDKISELIKYYKEIDDEFFEELEMILISADIGVSATDDIINSVKKKVKEEKIGSSDRIYTLLREEIEKILLCGESKEEKYPLLLLITGVNGVGKTTAIGKLIKYYNGLGKSVMVAAADTFRAAAVSQLDLWAQKSNAPIIKGAEGADPSSVVFDAIASAKARNIDVLICDTAGRLHNKKNLMDELSKINRIINREYPEAERKNLIVLDATCGQNAMSQIKGFSEAIGIDGIILNKLDGTAKGGIAIAIAKEMSVPILFVGVGEGVDDLNTFNAKDFAANII